VSAAADELPELAEPSILLVEDDGELADAIAAFLGSRGRRVVVARSGVRASRLLRAETFDAVLLDLLLPEADGIEICRQVRARDRWTPILILTALGAVDARLAGFQAGADDYLVKPFALAELDARVAVHLRRSRQARFGVVADGLFTLDTVSRRAWMRQEQLPLSEREFAVLRVLVERGGYVVSRTSLLTAVWGDAQVDQNIVEQYIRRIRRKLADQGVPEAIETVHGLGYRLRRARVAE
jgi:two-component system OmpR family response regulator